MVITFGPFNIPPGGLDILYKATHPAGPDTTPLTPADPDAPAPTASLGTPTPAQGETPHTPTDQQTVPSTLDIAAMQVRLQEGQQIQEVQQASYKALQLGTEQIQVEGSIRASAAARGLKMEGSPLIQMQVAGETGAMVRGELGQITQEQISNMSQAENIQWAGFKYSQSQQQEADRVASENQWLSFFTGAIGTAGSLLTKFWDPLAAAGTAASDVYNPVTV